MRRSNFTLVTMSQLLKVAVVGHLGKWHADKYAAATDCELVAVVSDAENARDIAQKHGAEAFPDDSDVIPLVDAVSLIVPTRRYYKIAGEFLEAGIHCLVEKVFADTAQPDLPITETTTNRCPPLAMVSELPESQLEVVREAMLVA
jgi:hypothetical protein